ncbi:MAG: efflux RND transporter periplasmic adaptor subunit [Lachnospiraceae bacterium]|nr:efflux RND transporter periplasmic adaptor subunit [Lachnospiraceae bacterium]
MKRRSSEVMKSRNNRYARGVALLMTVLLASGTVMTGCGKKEEATEEKDTSILVETVKPTTASIELDGEFIGTIESDNQINVIPKVAGDVTATYFEEGDHVNAGDLLFTIDDTGAQISMDQAQASLESAQASVETANAGVQAAELNLVYTQAQITENLGKVDTNQMQLENAVASAKYALKAAEENEALAAEQFGMARDDYEDLEDSLDDLKDDAHNMEKYADSLAAYKKVYDEIVNSTESSHNTAAQTLINAGIIDDADDINWSNPTAKQEAAEAYISDRTDGSARDLYTLGVMMNTAKNTADTMRSSRSTLDDNKDKMKLNMFSSAIGKETAKNNVLSAEDGKRLAEKMLQDYELYTKATILAGANAQLAGSIQSQVAAQSGLKQAQAGVKQAQAGVEGAQLQLDYTKVTAPVSGTITKKNVTTNNMAATGNVAYVITAEDEMNIVFYVAETVMRQAEVGQQIQVERNGEVYQAQITENAGVADANSGLFKLKAQFTGGAENMITGTKVKITMATDKADNVMTIPVDSVYYESRTAYVYVMEGGKAVRTEIETGITNNTDVEVKSGITKDSEIITTWAAQLRDGADVRLKGDSADTSAGSSETEADSVIAQAETEQTEESADAE